MGNVGIRATPVVALIGALLGLSVHAQQAASTAVGVPQVKITFADPLGAAPPLSGAVPREAMSSGMRPTDSNGVVGFSVIEDPKEQGAFAKVVDRRLSIVKVTWFDSKRFQTQAQVDELLRELLSSANTQTWTFQAWSYLNGQPSVLATVEHTAAKEGRWIVWCPPNNLDWVYEDGNGKWWWGAWESWRSAVPAACGRR